MRADNKKAWPARFGGLDAVFASGKASLTLLMVCHRTRLLEELNDYAFAFYFGLAAQRVPRICCYTYRMAIKIHISSGDRSICAYRRLDDRALRSRVGQALWRYFSARSLAARKIEG
jgi:hypothetical protein